MPRQSDPFANLPFNEEELLAYVEGELTPERQQEVRAFVEVRPELKRLLHGMRQDRLILSEIGDATAPDGLLDGTLAVLEREALFDGGTPAPAPIKVPRPGKRLQVFAMAAGFLLLAGGSTYLISLAITPPPKLVPSGAPLAMKPATESSIPTRIANAPPEVQTPVPDVQLDSSEADKQLARLDEPAVLAKADAAGTDVALATGIGHTYPTATITADRAVELALEGRLAVYITARESVGARTAAPGAPARDAGETNAVPSTGSLRVQLPATVSALEDLYATLAENYPGDVSFEELPEPVAQSSSPDQQIADLWTAQGTRSVTVPVLINEWP